jgi:hypothetical protein
MSISGVGFVQGIPELKAAFARMGVNFDFELGRALYHEGHVIMGRSKAFFVPVDHGPLRSSGHVQTPQADRGGTLIVLGFGGPAVKYAVVQHERLTYKHTVGQAKYLERPALERAAVMDQAVAERLRRRLKKIVAA